LSSNAVVAGGYPGEYHAIASGNSFEKTDFGTDTFLQELGENYGLRFMSQRMVSKLNASLSVMTKNRSCGYMIQIDIPSQSLNLTV
jgi:hypothetical protein